MRPKISVIMAAYNADRYINESVESLVNQTMSDWELICMDDGSTDTTVSILNSWSNRDNRITVLTQKNAGPAVARANAIKQCSGDFVIQLDADDYFSDDLLECTYQRAIETNADCVLPDLEFGEKLDRWNEFYNVDVNLELSGREAFCLTFPWRIHGLGLWRGSIARRVYIESAVNFNSYNSDEFITRVLFLNCSRIMFSCGVYTYRFNNESISKKVSVKRFYEVETNRRLLALARQNQVDTPVIRKIEQQYLENFVSQRLLFLRVKKSLKETDRDLVVELIKQNYFIILNTEHIRFRSRRDFIKNLLYLKNYWLFLITTKLVSFLRSQS